MLPHQLKEEIFNQNTEKSIENKKKGMFNASGEDSVESKRIKIKKGDAFSFTFTLKQQYFRGGLEDSREIRNYAFYHKRN